jgi:hypothetical protein
MGAGDHGSGARGAVAAAAVYAAAVFLCGFVLGTLRVLVIAPRVGDTVGVVLETPVILTFSWMVCRRCIARFNVAPGMRHRVMMGLVAFVLLQGAEFCLGTVLFGRAPADYVAAFAAAPGAIGLAAQVGFALLPVLVGRRADGPPPGQAG